MEHSAPQLVPRSKAVGVNVRFYHSQSAIDHRLSHPSANRHLKQIERVFHDAGETIYRTSSGRETSLGFRGFRYDSYFGSPAKASKYSVSNTLDTLRLLFEQGAQWRPDEPREVQWVRRNLLECEPDVTVELIEQLTKHNACTQDPIHGLLRTPTMKKHLTAVARKFALMGVDVQTKEQKAEDERRARVQRA